MKVFVILLVLIGLAVIFSANVYAMPPFHSQEIYDFSNVIVMGKVISVNSTFSPTHNLYEIKVEKFLKNQQDSDVLFASGQKTANIRLGNQVFDVNDRGLFYLTNNTMGYDPYSEIFLLYPTSQLIEPEWDKCNIFDKEIPREHWVFGGTGQMPTIHQGNNTDIENFAIGKEVLVSYDIFNHSLDTKNVTYGIMIKKIDESDYLYTETNNSYMLEPCVPYKTLTWTFTPTKSGQYAVEIYDLVGSQMGVWFTAKQSLPLCTSDRTACFQDEYICDSIGWECTDTENIFNTLIYSPLKQFKSGISFDEIQCKENLVLIQKYDGSPACVKPETEWKLIERGWTYNITKHDVYFLTVNGGYDIPYSISGANLSSITVDIDESELVIKLDNSTNDGNLIITLPRTLIDRKIGNDDGDFVVMINNMTINFKETRDEFFRTLEIPFVKGIETISITSPHDVS